MKHVIFKSIAFALVLTLCFSCKPKITAPAPSKGSLDLTSYVAIGNSITSGFADGALSYNGQMVSYPNLIAGQLKLINGVNLTFNQPLMPQGSIGANIVDSANVKYTYPAPFQLGYSTDCLGVNSLGPIPVAAVGDENAVSTNISAQGPFNNMGVPGARAIDVATVGYGNPANGIGNYNPFFTRMAKNQATSSMLSDAMLLNPTFFSLFIGNNDVLLYAANGGAPPATITSQAAFNTSINTIISTLTSNGAKGVVGNIPDITALPFFTTIPWNALTLSQGLADSLNHIYWANGTPGGLYNFKAGNNGFLIKDPSAPLGQRLMKEGELILLDVPLNSIKCDKLGSLKPIPNQYILTATEISNIQTAVSAFNSIIQSTAQAKSLAFVDVNAFLKQTQTGISYDGISLNAQFVTGGAFSLDGIHLNPIGNALLANQFIQAINNTYNSTIPQVDATKYRGILFP